MKDPIKVLFEEHEIILSAIEVAKQTDKLLAKDEIAYQKIVRQLIHFFRVYADQFHHYKEEKILFPEMNKKNELLEDGVIKEMFEHHEDFRNMIKSIENFLEKKEYMRAQQQLHIYIEVLLDHIAVENDEVFQMAETLFDKDELEKIYFRFNDCDREIGEQKKMELINNLNDINATLV
ncbi:MAG: hemerythrin domain-containing protein [Bacteroidia bacterium]